MSGLLTPFVTKQLRCPSCKEAYEQRFFRQRAFVADKRESDQHVTEYSWANDRLERVHPPYYFVFYCPHCRYADTADEYTKPETTDAGPMVLRQFKRLSPEQKAIADLLASNIDYENITYESALCLHLLALFIQSLAPPDIRDVYKQARLLLRIAWLYREQGGGVDGENETTDSAADALSPPGEESAQALDEAISRLEQNAAQQMLALQQLARAAQDRMDTLVELAGSTQDFDYQAIVGELQDLQKSQGTALGRLKELTENERMQTAARTAAPESPEASASDLAGLVRHVKSLFPLTPLTEVDAMRSAIVHFEKAISSDMRLSSHETYQKIIFLISDLYVRCGDIPGALGIIGGVYQSAMDTRRQVNELLRKTDLSDSEKRKLQGRLNRVTSSMEATGDRRHELLDMLLEQERANIDAILSQHPKAAIAQLEEILEEAGYGKDLIMRCKQRGGPLLALQQSGRK